MNTILTPGTDTLITALLLSPAGDVIDTSGWTVYWVSEVPADTDITGNLLSVRVHADVVLPDGFIGADWAVNVDRGDGYIRPLLSGTFETP